MEMYRRKFLKNSLASSMVVVAASFIPNSVLAKLPEKTKEIFKTKTLNDALDSLFGKDNQAAEDSKKISIKAPDIAENGAVVPIQVSCSLDNIQSISIMVEKNPKPFIASFNFTKKNATFVSTRVKMSATSNVIIIVKANDKVYVNKKSIEVTVGGCGG
jgi:sulfur-oxidizing protein SoxY